VGENIFDHFQRHDRLYWGWNVLLLNQNNMQTVKNDGTTYNYTPQIDLKTTGTRIITPSGVTCNGSPGGAERIVACRGFVSGQSSNFLQRGRRLLAHHVGFTPWPMSAAGGSRHGGH
jgi:hypothetical protein